MILAVACGVRVCLDQGDEPPKKDDGGIRIEDPFPVIDSLPAITLDHRRPERLENSA
jgi:hypothetical protein